MTARQAVPAATAWFERPGSQRLIHEHQRQIQPEISGVFGRHGLYLRAHAQVPESLVGHRLHSMLSLHRHGDGFAGALRCRDDALPIATESLALVCAMHVLESAVDPEALVAEIARVIEPEGIALLLVLNPFGITGLRWGLRGPKAIGPGLAASWVRAAGLDVVRTRYVGPWWRVRDALSLDGHEQAWLPARLRSAYLLHARRRDPALTPLRPAWVAPRLRPEMRPG